MAEEKFDIMAASGLGVDGIDESVLGMPLIQIVQKGSPEFDVTHKRHAERKIEGCKPGDIVFVRENKVLKQPVTVIPLAQSTCYTIWRPLASGGGLVGIEPLSISTMEGYARGQKGTPNENKEYFKGNEALLTIYVLVMFLDEDGQWKKGILSMTGTALRAARLWSRMLLSMKHPEMGANTPPIFASKWTLTTKIEQNEKGSWFGWNVAKANFLDTKADAALLNEAMATHKESAKMLPSANSVPQKALSTTEEPF